MSASAPKHLKTPGPGGSAKGGAKPTAAASQPAEEVVGGGVQIPLIRGKDNAKLLPVYTAALQRTNEEYVAVEELDGIQMELEQMLSNVALRYRVLKQEYDNLDKDDRRRSKHAAAVAAAAGGSNEKPVSPAATLVATTTTSQNAKRKRDDASSSTTVRKPKHTAFSSSAAASAKHSKHSKNAQQLAAAALNTDTDSMDCAPSGSAAASHGREPNAPKMALPKNDVPNKFWLSVEPYCMPLTNEDLRLLDDLIDQYSGPLVPPIPELGPHYTRSWAEEELKDVQQANAPSSRLKQQPNSGALRILKKAEAIVDNAVTGPLTQRLVSALMEEQLLQTPAPNEATAAAAESSNSSSENTASGQLHFRSLAMMRNGVGIEKRVKKELVELGILDAKDLPNNADEDEIHTEIKRLVAELTAVAAYNSSVLRTLRDSASEEIKRVEIKRKLDTVDQELCETYKRHMQNKAKRKPMTPEEQQEIFRLTGEQKALADQLEKTQTKVLTYD